MERSERIIESVTKCFENHVASYWKLQKDDSPTVEILRFKQPGTINYFIEFTLINGVLMVRGDLGSATYNWHSKINFEFLGGINIGYFAGKCEASEDGNRFVSWDADEARKTLLEHLSYDDDQEFLFEYMSDNKFKLGDDEDYTEAQYEEVGKQLAKQRYEEILKVCNIEDKWEWAADINSAYNPSAEDLFKDQDYWEWAYGVGEVASTRLFCHFIGLKLAVKQLRVKQMMIDLRDMNQCQPACKMPTVVKI